MAKKKQRRTVRTPAAKRPARKPTRPAPRKSKGKASGAAKAAPAGESPKQRALATLKFSHTMLTDLLKDWPEDKRLHQSSPTDNHALWTLGHLVTTYSWFGMGLGAAVPKPEGYDAMFGFGSKPHQDAAAYPPFDAVKAAADAAFDAFIGAAEAHSDADLLAPPAIDTGGFARDRLDLLEKAAWHEGWHAGQVSMLRRACGLKPLMG